MTAGEESYILEEQFPGNAKEIIRGVVMNGVEKCCFFDKEFADYVLVNDRIMFEHKPDKKYLMVSIPLYLLLSRKLKEENNDEDVYLFIASQIKRHYGIEATVHWLIPVLTEIKESFLRALPES